MAKIIKIAWSKISNSWFLERDPFDFSAGEYSPQFSPQDLDAAENLREDCYRIQNDMFKTAQRVYAYA